MQQFYSTSTSVVDIEKTSQARQTALLCCLTTPKSELKIKKMDIDKVEQVKQDDALSDGSHSSDDGNEAIEKARKELDSVRKLESEETFEAYRNIVSVLRSSGNDIFAIRTERKAFSKAFPLPPSLWTEWADDELMIASTADDRRFVADDVLRRGIQDYLSVPLCAKLLDLQIQRFQASECSADEVRATFEELKALGATAHFSGGGELWLKFLSFLDAAKASAEEKSAVLQEMRKQPIKLADDENMDMAVDSSKSDALMDVERDPEIKDCIDSCKLFESNLDDAGGNSSAETGKREDNLKMKYIMYAGHLAQRNVKAAQSVWERCIQECFLDSSLWGQYIRFCKEHLSHAEEKRVLQRARRNVPWDLSIWRGLVFNIMRRCEKNLIDSDTASDELMEVLQACHNHVYNSDDWNGAMRLSIAVVMCYSKLKHPSKVREPAFLTLGYNKEGSDEWGHCKFAIAAACIAEGDLDSAEQHMHDVITKRSTELHWWQRCAQLLVVAKCTPEKIRNLFKRGIDKLMSREHVEALGASWIEFEASSSSAGSNYEQIQETIENQLRVLPQTDQARKVRRERKQQKPKESATMGKRKTPETKKRRKVDGIGKPGNPQRATDGANGAAPKTNPSETTEPVSSTPQSITYEPNTVFLNNLTYKATEKEVREKFATCGAIKGIRIPKRGDGAAKGIAYIEFEDDEAVVAALKLHETPILGRQIWVRRSKPPRTQRVRGRGAAVRGGSTRGGMMRGRSRRGRIGFTLEVGETVSSNASRDENEDTVMSDSPANQKAEKVGGEQQKTNEDFRALLSKKT